MSEAVLIIDRSSSRCGHCRMEASPYEIVHDTRLGYRTRGERGPRSGCGATFVAVTTNYAGGQAELATRRMRPDLPFIDPMGLLPAALDGAA